MIQANPFHAPIGRVRGDYVALEVRFLGISQLAQIDGARLVGLQAQIGEKVRCPERVQLSPSLAKRVSITKSSLCSMLETSAIAEPVGPLYWMRIEQYGSGSG